MWISHSRWIPGSMKYSKWLKFKKKSSLKAHGRINCYIVGIFLRWSTASFVFFMRIWNLIQKRIVLRTRSGNASINRMSHYLDAQIQACTNEDPSVSGIQSLHRLQWYKKPCILKNHQWKCNFIWQYNGMILMWGFFGFNFRVRGYGI
jgi:hypothetical protein